MVYSLWLFGVRAESHILMPSPLTDRGSLIMILVLPPVLKYLWFATEDQNNTKSIGRYVLCTYSYLQKYIMILLDLLDPWIFLLAAWSLVLPLAIESVIQWHYLLA